MLALVDVVVLQPAVAGRDAVDAIHNAIPDLHHEPTMTLAAHAIDRDTGVVVLAAMDRHRIVLSHRGKVWALPTELDWAGAGCGMGGHCESTELESMTASRAGDFVWIRMVLHHTHDHGGDVSENHAASVAICKLDATPLCAVTSPGRYRDWTAAIDGNTITYSAGADRLTLEVR
jgi:hypothetical protein